MMQRFASLAGRSVTLASSVGRTSTLTSSSTLTSTSTLTPSSFCNTSRHYASSTVVGSDADAIAVGDDADDANNNIVENMPFVHHGHRPRHRNYEKFKSPRKRASKLFLELNDEACQKQKEAFPVIWQEEIRVGDSVELRMVSQGGVGDGDHNTKDKDNKQELERIRGVVLGIVHRGLGSSLVLRDVVYGLPIERRIPMYSPMIKEATVLERNFVFKDKKKVKRAKLYYFRDRNPLLTKVSKY